MSDNNSPRSLVEIMNDVLSAVRDYYDAEYAYYIEKEFDDVVTIYEWCAEYAEMDEAGDHGYHVGQL